MNLRRRFHIWMTSICGVIKEEHDLNLQNFLNAARKITLTFNMDRCVFGQRESPCLATLLKMEKRSQIQTDLRP